MTKVNRISLKEARERAESAMPERLQRLNRELAIEQTKHFDYLFATRNGYRFRVCVFRNDRGGFFATTTAGGSVRRYSGDTPADAFYALVNTLVWVVSKLDFEKNVAIYEARKYQTA